jgi:peptidoglycan/LPS O-acetylase OafA/YrhL
MRDSKLREIERLRAVAVLMVIFAHTGPPAPLFGAIFSHPRTGVDLFFVISGFVVTRSLVRQLPEVPESVGLADAFDRSRDALRRFYTRRFFRIVPLAVAVVVLQRLLFVAGFPPSELGGDLVGYWREVCAIFTGVYNYAMPNEGYNQFGVFWSLSVEEHFYLLLPLAFVFARTRGKRLAVALVGIAVVVVVCRNFFDVPPPGTDKPEYYRLMTSHLRFDSLLAGVALALVPGGPATRPLMPPGFVRWVALPFCLALVWAIPRALPLNTYLHEGFTATWFLCGILVGYAALDRGYVLPVPVFGRVLEYVGGRSYAMYLLHIPLLRIEGAIVRAYPGYGAFASHNPWTHWALFVLAVVLAAEVSWQVLEWPMQRLGRRLTGAPSPSSGASAREPAPAASLAK